MPYSAAFKARWPLIRCTICQWLARKWLGAVQLRFNMTETEAGMGAKTKLPIMWYHRLFGFVWADSLLDPYPLVPSLVLCALWNLELYTRIAIAHVCYWLGLNDNKEIVLHAVSTTGLGDLFANATFACFVAREMGVRRVAIDWRNSSYLTDAETNLFTELFDVVKLEGGPEIVPIGDVDASKVRLAGPSWSPFTVASFGCRDASGAFHLAPQLLQFGGFKEKWRGNDNDDWWDAPLHLRPPPTPAILYLPFNRAGPRRIMRDERHFVESIRLKPRFLQQFEGFRASSLDGKPTIGVHYRHGNGETGHFTIHGRADASPLAQAVERIHSRVLRYVGLLPAGQPYQVLVMSDSKAFIDEYRALKSGGACQVITREQWKPAEGQGAFYVAGSAMDGFNANEVCAPPDPLQLAADAVIDMLALGHCDVFLATAHSMFTLYPAKVGQTTGAVCRQLGKARRDHESDYSVLALCEWN